MLYTIVENGMDYVSQLTSDAMLFDMWLIYQAHRREAVERICLIYSTQ